MQRAITFPYIVIMVRGEKTSQYQFYNLANAREFCFKAEKDGCTVSVTHAGLPFKFEEVR